ncbi:hypothetical protein C5167_036895 [Papaver somniferum]|uniref:Uncharacterized protein n=1 Tax=Papaver somniferum TaxID=3469 RepID=A0A4Y7I972_PAPSO|nr:hypothetical protein C5167_036895 [Papaver somniferum]
MASSSLSSSEVCLSCLLSIMRFIGLKLIFLTAAGILQSFDNVLVLTVPWLQRDTKDYGVSQNIIELEYLRQAGMFFYKYIPRPPLQHKVGLAVVNELVGMNSLKQRASKSQAKYFKPMPSKETKRVWRKAKIVTLSSSSVT